MKEQRLPSIRVRDLLNENKTLLSLKLATGKRGLDRIVTKEDLYIPGLALTGFFDEFPFDRVQVLGNSEILYLATHKAGQRKSILKQFFDFEIPCVIVTTGNTPPPDLVAVAEERDVCVFCTPYSTSQLVSYLTDYLAEKFAPHVTINGSLVDVYGVGILITGRSGIGKSEIALDLVERGHRLVADDIVTITKRGRGILIGSGGKNIQHHMEIRGIGIIDVMSLYGIRGLRLRKRIEVEVQLAEDKLLNDFDRTGLNTEYKEYMGIKIPTVKIPIFPGKNITVIAETVALNTLLKLYGYDSAKEFNKRLIQVMKQKLFQRDRLQKFFE